MNATETKAVVMPIYDDAEAPFLRTLASRSDGLTCLIRGWRNPGAPAMRTPARILEREQRHLPFLFRPLAEGNEDQHAVTHVALCGLLLHRADVVDAPAVRDWLHAIRVEQFSLPCDSGWRKQPPDEVSASFYVVTAGRELQSPIPLASLQVVSTGAALSRNLRQAYAVVWLPSELLDWYSEACDQWDRLASQIPSVRRAHPLGARSRSAKPTKTVETAHHRLQLAKDRVTTIRAAAVKRLAATQKSG
jgi:hypothetical protein